MIITGLLIGLVVLIGLGILGLGLSVIWGSVGNLWERWVAFIGALCSRSWAETQGTITRAVVVRRQWRRQVSYEPAIRYTYSTGGKQLEGELRNFDMRDGGSFETARATVERLPVGSSQRVYYDASVPRRATLARDVPPVFWLTLGWLVVALIGVAVAGLGADIVVAAFTEPPELGELPTMLEQVGGLLVGAGAMALMIAGIRALLEREARRLLRFVAAAKLTGAGQVRAGERVAVFGRAEADGEAEADELDLLFGEQPHFYLHSDLASPDNQLTRTSSFVVRDGTGAVQVEPSDGQSRLGKQSVAIQGDVERWLDRYELGLGSSVSGDRRATMNVERINEGSSVLVVAQTFEDGSGLMLRSREGDPLSLLLADEPLPEVLARLKRKPRVTLVLGCAGGLSVAAGAVALLL